MVRILVTCPPMLGMKEQFIAKHIDLGVEFYCPEVVQTLSVEELVALVPQFDGWIIGDDPATRAVFESGKRGKLKAAVKWGIGVDNVDFVACKDLGIPIINTPNMFGGEVADVAVGYIIGLARETYLIDRDIRAGLWPKNRGISLSGKTVGLIGYGDIGSNVAKRLLAADMKIIAYDPAFDEASSDERLEFSSWPDRIAECDFLVFTCALNQHNHHMLNSDILEQCHNGVRIVNVARGPLIDEVALVVALQQGKVHSVALDVFEVEPIPDKSPLRDMPLSIFGSHNGSNTSDAVAKTNDRAIDELFGFLDVK